MVVDGRQVNARIGGNGAEGSGLEAAAGEEALGGIEDPALRVHTFVSIVRMNQGMSRIGEWAFNLYVGGCCGPAWDRLPRCRTAQPAHGPGTQPRERLPPM